MEWWNDCVDCCMRGLQVLFFHRTCACHIVLWDLCISGNLGGGSNIVAAITVQYCKVAVKCTGRPCCICCWCDVPMLCQQCSRFSNVLWLFHNTDVCHYKCLWVPVEEQSCWASRLLNITSAETAGDIPSMAFSIVGSPSLSVNPHRNTSSHILVEHAVVSYNWISSFLCSLPTAPFLFTLSHRDLFYQPSRP